MNQFSTNILRFHGPNEGVIGKYFNASRKWLHEAISRRKSYNQTIFELSVCSDRELADMGIARCDIRRLAREAAQSKTFR